MAEGDSTDVPVTICDLCDSPTKTLFMCINCDSYLCDNCVLSHERIKETKNHMIKQSGEYDRKQREKNVCSAHPAKKLDLFCRTCDETVCSECIIVDHQGHNCSSVNDVAQEAKLGLKKVLKEIKEWEIPVICSKIGGIDKDIHENNKVTNDTIYKINSRVDEVVSCIDQIRFELTHRSKQLKTQNKNQLEQMRTTLWKKLSEFESLADECGKAISGSDVERISAEKKLQLVHRQLKSTTTDASLTLPKFIPGTTDPDSIQQLFGSFEQESDLGTSRNRIMEDSMVVSSFQLLPDTVWTISPMDVNKVWLSFGGPEINLVTRDGQIIHTLNTDHDFIRDLIDTSDGFLMVAETDDIYKLSEKGLNMNSTNTSPLRPLKICKSSDGNILVTMVEKWSYKIRSDSKRIVARISSDGTRLNTYEYDGETRLFVIPYGLAENVNLDICVVNRIKSNQGNLQILDKNGKLRFTYKGNEENEEFDPAMVRCDSIGNIIVNDDANRKLHLLDRNGEFILYIMTPDKLLHQPFTLAIDKEEYIWSGCRNGQVYVIKYKH